MILMQFDMQRLDLITVFPCAVLFYVISTASVGDKLNQNYV